MSVEGEENDTTTNPMASTEIDIEASNKPFKFDATKHKLKNLDINQLLLFYKDYKLDFENLLGEKSDINAEITRISNHYKLDESGDIPDDFTPSEEPFKELKEYLHITALTTPYYLEYENLTCIYDLAYTMDLRDQQTKVYTFTIVQLSLAIAVAYQQNINSQGVKPEVLTIVLSIIPASWLVVDSATELISNLFINVFASEILRKCAFHQEGNQIKLYSDPSLIIMVYLTTALLILLGAWSSAFVICQQQDILNVLLNVTAVIAVITLDQTFYRLYPTKVLKLKKKRQMEVYKVANAIFDQLFKVLYNILVVVYLIFALGVISSQASK